MKKFKGAIILVAIVILFLYLFGLFVNYYGDWLWFKNMGYSSIFDTMILSKIFSFLVFFFIFGLFSAVHIRSAYKRGSRSRDIELIREEDPRSLFMPLYKGKAAIWFWGVVIIFFSTVMGSSASGHWNEFLQYLNSSSFDIKEPVFGKDVGFYIFKFPVYRFAVNWYIFMTVFTFIAVLFSYYLDNAFNVSGNHVSASRQVKGHLILLAAFSGLGISSRYIIKLFNILYSSHGVTYGPSYMDIHAQIPAYWTLLVISLIITLLLFLFPLYKKGKIILYGIGAWIIVLVGFGLIYPNIVEQYSVKPNELRMETPYIINNIKFTRAAFGLDKIKTEAFPVDQNITYKDIQNNHHTIENIRLWDRRPLIQTYKQLQEIRLYYDFNSVQVDRYLFDKYTEVVLGARELPFTEIPERAQTWVNQHLIYTHGYGIVMNPVNEITSNGLPNLIVKDIPPSTTVPLNLKQMAIYYGEETSQYLLVNTTTREFDYPKGEDNVYASYKGKGGVQISSLFRRMVYAWKFSDIKILLTGYITDQSRIMFYRNITQRDQILAPFLSFDSQPYTVIGNDGNLYWIHDAYTVSNMFPYSEPTSLNTVAGGSNYINNSVKVVINAYDGAVTYYVINPKDPMIQTFQKIYPKLFKPFNEMPEFLKEHIRYPTDLFNIQIEMYNTYHMTDPQVFYNQEDYWQVPNELYDTGQQELFPYYIIMRLPEAKKEEFILMLPLTPSGKDNMIAWMCARCDAPNYGDLIVYSFPKDKLIYGPMQIEARINQKPDISSELTLWSQKGSQVIKGNQLVIPIENSFIYVEPVYLQSEQGQIPELKRVIVAFNEKIEMKETLDEALQAIFNIAGVQGVVPQQLAANQSYMPVFSTQASEALDHYNKALDYLKQDNWSDFGNELQQMKSVLLQMAGTKPDVNPNVK